MGTGSHQRHILQSQASLGGNIPVSVNSPVFSTQYMCQFACVFNTRNTGQYLCTKIFSKKKLSQKEFASLYNHLLYQRNIAETFSIISRMRCFMALHFRSNVIHSNTLKLSDRHKVIES